MRLDEMKYQIFDLGSANLHYLKGVTYVRANLTNRTHTLIAKGVVKIKEKDSRTWRATVGWGIFPEGDPEREDFPAEEGWEEIYTVEVQ